MRRKRGHPGTFKVKDESAPVAEMSLRQLTADRIIKRDVVFLK